MLDGFYPAGGSCWPSPNVLYLEESASLDLSGRHKFDVSSLQELADRMGHPIDFAAGLVKPLVPLGRRGEDQMLVRPA